MNNTTNAITHELVLLSKGFTRIAGIDEVGRGCLAGPVLTACVELPLDKLIDGVRDSKLISAPKREKLCREIKNKALNCTVAFRDNKCIDSINILNATKQAMIECAQMAHGIDCVMVDAIDLQCSIKSYPLIHGDGLSYLIAAASIVAKVTRDKLMEQYALQYPQYGFERNKGYGTAEHIKAIKQYGLCPIHRRTFTGKFI